MTSLDLFKSDFKARNSLQDWGTGKINSNQRDKKLARAPTWHGEGTVKGQRYGLTELKLCKNRMTDELVPRPIDISPTELMGPKSITAEHPFSSHISRFEMFPNFTFPNNNPGAQNSILATKKIKGNPYRQEIYMTHGKNEITSCDATLNELRKSKSKFYPIPKTIFGSDNLMRNSSEKSATFSPRTSNALDNIENKFWKSNYTLSHTAFVKGCHNTSQEMSKSVPQAFIPPKALTENYSKTYQPKMTLHEKEEFRLFNGTKYINLPDTANKKLSDVTRPIQSCNASIKNNASFTEKPQREELSDVDLVEVPGYIRNPQILLHKEPSNLREIQDTFTKTEAHKLFHDQYRGSHPDLRQNIISGRKHQFGSLNAQVMRGALLVA